MQTSAFGCVRSLREPAGGAARRRRACPGPSGAADVAPGDEQVLTPVAERALARFECPSVEHSRAGELARVSQTRAEVPHRDERVWRLTVKRAHERLECWPVKRPHAGELALPPGVRRSCSPKQVKVGSRLRSVPSLPSGIRQRHGFVSVRLRSDFRAMPTSRTPMNISGVPCWPCTPASGAPAGLAATPR